MSRDDARLLDILIAARKAREFVQGIDEATFIQDELRQHAIVRMLTIIGEAASGVSPSARAAHPDIPWSAIIGMRNRIVHEYWRVNLAIVWETLQRDLPDLIAAVEPLIPPDPT